MIVSEIDPFLVNYQPSERGIASEFLTTWLPFLLKDLCSRCTQILTSRVRSLGLAESKMVVEAAEDSPYVYDTDDRDDSCDSYSLGSWKNGCPCEEVETSVGGGRDQSSAAPNISASKAAHEPMDPFGKHASWADIKAPTSPVKEDTPKPIAMQFRSISPGLVNRLQILARTSSAPPNLDEQKRNQAQFGSFRAVPTVPVPTVSKQPLPEKDAGILKQAHGVDPHSGPRVKKEPHVSSVPSPSLPQKPPVIPISGIPIQVPFHQQQGHLPYGVPHPSIPAQGMPGAAPMHLPLPMHYPMGSAPQMQRQIFLPNIQSHPMQHQGMTNQGQGMGFTAQMGPHMPHQLGNLGMNMPPQYSPQQTGKQVTPRKAVVITHPDTLEELKLDKRGDKYGEGGLPGLQSQTNVPSQTIPSHPSGPIKKRMEKPKEKESAQDLPRGTAPSVPVTGRKEKTVPDQNRPKSASSKGKKKLKKMLQKADAAGSTSDLYNAYKAPDEHKGTDQSSESENTRTVMNEKKMMPGGSVAEDSNNRESASQSKGVPDDWEDVAEVAMPEAVPPDNGEHHGEPMQHECQNLTKKYSRDFLLKFQSLNYNLPDVASALVVANASNDHLNRNPGSPTGGSHPDHHGAAMDDDKWSKVQGRFVHNRDNGNNAAGFRPAQGGSSSVLRNPRHLGTQKGLFPSPQTPQLMHKAEKKYEVGKVADEEPAKQRRLTAILNKEDKEDTNLDMFGGKRRSKYVPRHKRRGQPLECPIDD